MGIGSKYTKGIEIEIGGNTTKLKTALDTANRSIKATQTELDTLKNSLKLEWSADNFKRAQELAQRAVKETTEKADILKKSLAELGKQGGQKNTEQYEAIRRELSYVEVAAQKAQNELKGLNNAPLDKLKESIGAAGDRLDAMGNKLTAGLTVPLAAVGVAAVKYASDTAEAVNKVEVAFGDAAEGVETWSDTTLTSIGLAKGTALDMAALYGDMATSMGFADDEAAGMSKTLVNLAGDMASFKNISIGQANTALSGIFTGESEAMKQLGVIITETNMKSYAMSQGIEKNFESFTQAEKVALRYKYVLEATANSQGDFARTSDSTANQLRIMQESLKELAATAGDELLPIITPIIAQINELLQSFGGLDEETRGLVVQTGLFLATLGPMLKLTGGLTTVVNAGIVAFTALKAALVGATATQTTLNVAMTANPVGLLVTAIGTLIAVLGSFAVTAALTAKKSDTLASSIREARKEYESTSAQIEKSSADVLGMVSALEALAQQEHRSGSEKAVMLGLVEQLNEAVPNLSLAYDEQTDTLNMSVDAVKRLAQAEYDREQQAAAVDRLKAAYREQIALANELEAAQEKLRDAEAELAEMEGLGQKNEKQASRYWVLTGSVIGLSSSINELTGLQAGNEAEVSQLSGEYDLLDKKTAGAADSTSALSQKVLTLTDVLGGVQGGYEMLAKAQKEVNDSGSLSISTLTSLLDKYPDLAKYLVETADGYVLTEGALQNYMAAQRAEYQIACTDAQTAAQAVVDAEIAKGDAIIKTTDSIREQIKALIAFYSSAAGAIETFGADYKNNDDFYAQGDAKIRGLNTLLTKLEAADANLATFDRGASMVGRDYGSGGGKSGGGSSSDKKGPTQAEKDLAAYKDAVAELDHLRAMDKISEEQYYEDKAALGELYLKENKEERERLDEELYAWKKGAYDRDLATLEEALEGEEITWEEYLEKRLQLQNEHLTQGSEEWEDAERDRIEKAEQLRKSAYDKERDDLDYRHDIGLVSDEDYYAELAVLRDKYLEQNSEAWRDANVELYDYMEKCREEELEAAEEAYQAQLDALKDRLDTQNEAAKDAYDAQVDALKDALAEEKDALKNGYQAEKDAAKAHYQDTKDALKQGYQEAKEAAKVAYTAKKEQIQAELDLEKERLNTIMEGIDAEIQARKELREDENQDDAIAAARKRLEAAQAQREFARTEEDKIQWDKEIIRLQQALEAAIQDKEDTAFYREKEEEKEAVQEELTAAEEAAKRAQEQVQAEYDAKIKQLEADYDASTAKAEADYNASLVKMEADYNANLTRLEAEYEAKLAQAKADYEGRLSRIQRDYDDALSRLDTPEERVGAGGGSTPMDPAILGIAKEQGVSYDVAKNMHEANQRNQGNADLPYYAGAESAATERAATSAFRAAMTGVMAAAQEVTSIVNNRNASVTIAQAPSLTEGQVARAVEKVLEKLDR